MSGEDGTRPRGASRVSGVTEDQQGPAEALAAFLSRSLATVGPEQGVLDPS
jgi:hypothetical protein